MISHCNHIEFQKIPDKVPNRNQYIQTKQLESQLSCCGRPILGGARQRRRIHTRFSVPSYRRPRKKSILWRVSTGQEVKTFSGHDDWTNAVAISPYNSGKLLTGTCDKFIEGF